MQAFLASDVLYQARIAPLIKHALDEAEIGGQRIATSRFLPGHRVAERADRGRPARAASSARGDGGDSGEPAPGPARHRARVASRSATPRCSPTRPTASRPPTTRRSSSRFTNQGENDEFDVKVTLTVEGGDKPIKARARSTRSPAARPPRRRSPLGQAPPDRRGGDRQGRGREGARRGEDRQQHRRVRRPVHRGLASRRAVALRRILKRRERPDRSGGHRRPVGGRRGADRPAARASCSPCACGGCGRRSASCSASTATTDLVAHAAALQQAFAALHDRVEEVAASVDERMGAAEERLDGAIAYRSLVRYDAYGELTGQPVDDDRAARRRAQRRRPLLDRPPRHRRASTASRSSTGRGELELSPEEAEAVRLALAGESAATLQG